MAQIETRPLDGGNYKLPAVAKGADPFVLEITDQVQLESMPVTGQEIRRIITAEERLNDLLHCWTTNAPYMAVDAHPGIWGSDSPTPTAEDRAENERKQNNFLDALVSVADAIPADRRKEITPLMKIAAKHLGYDRDWLTANPNSVEFCPYCKTQVKAGAVKCAKCGEIVDFEAYGVLEARKQAAVAAATPKIPIPPPVQNRPANVANR